MTWTKLGRIYEPTFNKSWAASHAQLPVAMHLEGDLFRIFYGTRNENNLTQTSYVDIDITDPGTVVNEAKRPVLELGSLGSFDDSGVYPSSIVQTDDETRLYYIGWMQGKRVSYYASVGLATSAAGKHFEKASQAPHLSRTDVDPYMTLSSCVREDEGTWRMWYTSATEWEEYEHGTKPNYHIKYAESSDGLNWSREGRVCIDYKSPDEWAIACPTVVRMDGTWRMWYSHVIGDTGYRIGYAESVDGKNWTRHDNRAGIQTAIDGWDSQMQAYPNAFKHEGDLYLLYNGNDYGSEGFGLAVWD